MDVHDIFTVLVAALDRIERIQGAPETRLRALLFSAAADIAPQFVGSITRRAAQVEDDYQANDPIFLVGADAAVQVVESPQSAPADVSGLFDFWEPPEESTEVTPPGSLAGGYARDELVHVQGDTYGGDVRTWAQPLTEQALRSATGAAEAERLNGALMEQNVIMVDGSRRTMWSMGYRAADYTSSIDPSPAAPPAPAEVDFGSVERRIAFVNEGIGEPWPSGDEAPEAQSDGFAVSGTASGRITSSRSNLPDHDPHAAARWRTQRHAELAWIEGKGPVPSHIDPWDYRVSYVGPLARKIDDYRQENASIRKRARDGLVKRKQALDELGPSAKKVPGRWDF